MDDNERDFQPPVPNIDIMIIKGAEKVSPASAEKPLAVTWRDCSKRSRVTRVTCS